jgi:hypothetical protein
MEFQYEIDGMGGEERDGKKEREGGGEGRKENKGGGRREGVLNLSVIMPIIIFAFGGKPRNSNMKLTVWGEEGEGRKERTKERGRREGEGEGEGEGEEEEWRGGRSRGELLFSGLPKNSHIY